MKRNTVESDCAGAVTRKDARELMGEEPAFAGPRRSKEARLRQGFRLR